MSKLPENNTYTALGDLVDVLANRFTNFPFSDEVTRVCQWITFSALCQAVALFGVISNIINIICFIKQGFKDPVNVSFFGLAVADLCCLVTIMWTNLFFSPAFVDADWPFAPMEFQHLIGGIPHTAFTRVSSWITAIITMERCMCIIAPLKVKGSVTSRRVSILIVSVFLVLLGNTAPIYVVNRIGWRFFPERNRSLIGLILMNNRESVEKVSYIINNICIPFLAFAIIIMCTIILVVQLHNKTKWRKKSTYSGQVDNVSTRNQKVAKMVVMISVLFITCFVPMCIFFIAMSLEPELSIVGRHRNALLVFVGFATLMESVNSASNIFIYYDMSSRYRTALRELLGFTAEA